MYDRLISWENLLLAYKRASRGKRGQANVAAFEHVLEDNLLALMIELGDQSYRPGAYENFLIHDPKRRLISAAPFRDRVVHHALCNLIEPVFDRCFVNDSYANRTGRGTHLALDRCQKLARCFRYVLQCDVRQFFPSIDHAILRALLATKIRDPRILWLIDRILESGQGVLDDVYNMVYFRGDDLFAALRPRGLPIGNLTSQFWANVYLNPLDHFIKRELLCKGYVRYVDDLLLFSDTKSSLWNCQKGIEDRLAGLRLTIHRGAHPRPVTEGIPFLGFIVFPERRRLKRRNGVRFRRKLHSMIDSFSVGRIALDEITQCVQGWVNHARYGNTIGLRKAVLSSARVHRPTGKSTGGNEPYLSPAYL